MILDIKILNHLQCFRQTRSQGHLSSSLEKGPRMRLYRKFYKNSSHRPGIVPRVISLPPSRKDPGCGYTGSSIRTPVTGQVLFPGSSLFLPRERTLDAAIQEVLYEPQSQARYCSQGHLSSSLEKGPRMRLYRKFYKNSSHRPGIVPRVISLPPSRKDPGYGYTGSSIRTPVTGQVLFLLSPSKPQ